MYNVAETRKRRTADNNLMKQMSDLTDFMHRYARKSLATCTGTAEKVVFRVSANGQFCCLAFLGVFEKLRNATIRVVMFVRPHGTTRLPFDGVS